LHFDRVNLNQGAESTLAFLLALEEMTTLQISTAASTEVTNAAETAQPDRLPGSNPSFAQIHA
jgi:hypothetical protein